MQVLEQALEKCRVSGFDREKEVVRGAFDTVAGSAAGLAWKDRCVGSVTDGSDARCAGLAAGRAGVWWPLCCCQRSTGSRNAGSPEAHGHTQAKTFGDPNAQIHPHTLFDPNHNVAGADY